MKTLRGAKEILGLVLPPDPLTVTMFYPADESTNVSIASNIVVTFSEPIARGTGFIALKNATGTVIENFDAASSTLVMLSGATLTINPSADLNFSTGYRVELAAGTLQGLGGAQFAGTTSYNFSTLPTGADFASVVDLADIAAGTGGFAIHGQDAGDQSGNSVASAGDINGDGFDDLIIGAAFGDGANNGKSNAGDSYVVFGKATGFVAAVDLEDIAAGTGGFVMHGQDAMDLSGYSVASAGDINGDGFDDLIVGAAWGDGANDGKANAGDSYVVFGKAGGFNAAIDLGSIAAGTGGFVIHGQDVSDYSGSSVASAGDINGDGFDDLIVGAVFGDAANDAKPSAGESYVVFGKASGFDASLDLSNVASGSGGFVIYGQDANDASGWSVASAGDINSDGFDDLLIGARQGDAADNAKADAGDSYVVFGKATGFGAAVDLVNIAAGTGGFVVHGQDAGDQAGWSVASAGDINGDGFGDLIIGARWANGSNNTKAQAGDSYVVFGKAAGFGTAIALGDVASGVGGFVIHGQDANDGSGWSVASAGDINGDGFDDLLIGAHAGDAANNAKDGAGDSYVFFGKAAGFGAAVELSDIAAGVGGFVIHGQDAGDDSGYSLAPAGDINGDGFDDLIIGAQGGNAANNAKADAGDSYVIFGRDFKGLVTHPGTTSADNLSGSGGADVMVGGLGNDTLSGGAGADAIRGGAGADTILGGSGADRMDGGSGRDTADYITSGTGVRVNLAIHAQSGGDAQGDVLSDIEDVAGSDFGDALTGDASANALNGRAGNDTLDGGSGNDTVNGGDGNDSLAGGLNFDSLVGGTGNDTLRGGEQADTLLGGEGDDLLNGGKGTDSLDGGAGNDTLVGALGTDLLLGGDGIDTADYSGSTDGVVVNLGLAGAQQVSVATGLDTLAQIENLIGSNFNDTLSGDAGNNSLTGLLGNDVLTGLDGFDLLDGGAGDDNLNGGINADTLVGGLGNDFLSGGKGTDSLDGGDGNDSLTGGLGTDRLTGGAGADRFTFRTALDGSFNIDTLTDFVGGEDLIELSASIFGAFAGQVGNIVGTSANLAYDNTTGVLAYDPDGAGGNPAITFAILGTSTHPAALGNAFLIVA